MKKRIMVLLSLCLLALFTSCNDEGKALQIVKNGYFMEINENLSVGEACDDFFITPKYNSFKHDNGYTYVEIEGKPDVKRMIKGAKNELIDTFERNGEEIDQDFLNEMITALEEELAVMDSILMQFRVDVKEKTFIINYAEFNGVQDDSLSVISTVMMGALGYGKDLVQEMFNSLYF